MSAREPAVDGPVPTTAEPARWTRRAVLGGLTAAVAGAVLWRDLGAGADAPVLPPRRRWGPLLDTTANRKDPSLLRLGDGGWLLFATGDRTRHGWEIVRARADDPGGPWVELPPARVDDVIGNGVAAPGVTLDGDALHLFVQTEFEVLGGAIEHAVSTDGGATFHRVARALASDVGSGESGLYDVQPATLGGHPYLAYAAMRRAGAPDLHVARSTTGSWHGPWERLGPALRQIDVPFHAGPGDPDHEWGLEGPQLVELPDGRVLLVGVCFVRGRRGGHRQRVVLALGPAATGPFTVLGVALEPATGAAWERGENGHACAVVDGDRLLIAYQARAGAMHPWRLGMAEYDLASLLTSG